MFNRIPQKRRPLAILLTLFAVCVVAIAGNALYSSFVNQSTPVEEVEVERNNRQHNSIEKAYDLGIQ